MTDGMLKVLGALFVFVCGFIAGRLWSYWNQVEKHG
jgi:hypothetical protein